MKNKWIAACIIIGMSLFLSACGFFDKDNTPQPSALPKFKPEATVKTLWTTSAGWGAGDAYLKFPPAVGHADVFVANKNGTVTAIDKLSGRIRWQTNTKLLLGSGPSLSNQVIIIGSRRGDVIALDQSNGKIIWKTKVSDEVLATPASTESITFVKTIDGKIVALSSDNGKIFWQYQQTEPAFMLRGSSSPQIDQNAVIVGFGDGTLAKLSLCEGKSIWQQTIALPDGIFAIQRMVDIDADPIVKNNRVYAATYQGNIAALDKVSGKIIWTHAISSYSGIAADTNQVYVADTNSILWSFSSDNGAVHWQQTQLKYRNITGPVDMGDTLVVGDAEGYLHWISKKDGHFVARIKVPGTGMLATPFASGNILYVVTKNGYLAAYQLYPS